MVYLILFFLLGFFNSSFLSLSLSLSPTHLCRPEQSSALLKFKSNLSISVSIYKTHCLGEVHIPSHKTDSWDEGPDCCKWKGVVCDNKKGNVIGLDLSCRGLIGSLQSNSSLFSLQNLRWLNLAGNYFSNSKIPSEFGKLRSLTYLNLSLTGFTGFVPPEISLLSELVSLDLSLNPLLFRNHDFNMLVHNLRKLENMVLDRMNLSLKQIGAVPLGCWMFQRQAFQKGYPTQLVTLKHLKTLGLSHCVFTEFIPSALGNLTKITFLDISGNMFQGQIPDVFGNLNDLSFMDFSSNKFSGVFPPSAFNLTSLTFMDFSSNFL
ncbi:receptor-like protein 35 [Gossypium raimondii]|uniref:receptor-like protein 35 n=1 Tax=Gossypium raimondii TaxID=29730 RepID=UPI00227C246B|nr:receptor-like protein 35 [Gossypium raimondii]